MGSNGLKPTISLTEYVSVSVSEKPRRRGCATHCLKFWWAYLIVFVCITVLAICVVIFVGIPRIAQQTVDAATLTIDGITMSNTQSENYTMAINSTIHISSSFTATLDGFTGQLYLEDVEPHTPFASLDFPPTTSAAEQVVNVTQFTPITNMAAFTEFNIWLLANDSVRVTVAGDTFVRLSGISKSFPISFTKTVTIPGISNFKGMAVSQANVSLNYDAQGDNFRGLTTIPNPSIVTFTIGNSSFRTYLLGQEIGTSFIDNMVLYPGDNSFRMRGNMTQAPILAALGEQPYCSNGGVVPLQLSGKSVVNQGQNLSYFADALASQNQTLNIDIGQTLKTDLNITVPCSQ